jgi:hypothetical protein
VIRPDALVAIGKKTSGAKILLRGRSLGTESNPAAHVPLSGVPPSPPQDAEDEAEAAVIRRATEVLGSRPDALRWLGTPVRALDYATPVSLLHDAAGRDAVLTVLGRLEHGVL